MTDFFTDYGVAFALGCAGAAVVYGLLITQRLLAKSAGNDRMQEISGAIASTRWCAAEQSTAMA